MAMGLASSPLFSAPILLRRQLNHHHPHLFSTFASLQLPFSLLSRESAISNPPLPSLCYIKSTACKVSRSPVEVEDVNGVEISIGEGDDSILAYRFTAVKNNNGTGILLLFDILGFEVSSTRDFAYRVACNGYNVLVLDLFHADPWAKDKPKTLFKE
ncbi:hypothetical protein ACSBR2_037317 [Camellia fascicularis]